MTEASHHVAPELILPAAVYLANDVGSRRPAEVQQPIDNYTRRILGVVAYFGYGVEYQAAARLHRIGEDSRINRDWFYKYEQHLPFCVADAVLLMDNLRYAPVHERLRSIVTSAIATVVTYSEAVANTGGQLEGAPADTMSEARVALLTRCLEPLLPPIDMPV